MLSRSGPATRLPVTDLFFRSLAGLLHHRIALSQSDPRRSHKKSYRCLDRTAAAGGHRLWRRPKYLIRDNDSKFGLGFARVAQMSNIEILKTPSYAPRANAICERFLGSVRRECLDHLLILHEKQLHRMLNAYMHYFNRARPHQGIKQQIPEQKTGSVPPYHESGKVISFPVLGGLHNDYRRSA